MYLHKKRAVRKTASLERHSLSLALRKRCKCMEAGSNIRGKYVCVSFPREKHVSCVLFPAREKRKDNEGEGRHNDKKGKRKAYEKGKSPDACTL